MNINEGLLEIAKRDPVAWCKLKRRYKRRPFIYDLTRVKAHAGHLEQLENDLLHGDPVKTQAAREILKCHRPWLLQPIRDPAPKKVFKKCRQVGVTEASITEEGWFLDSHPGTKWMHTFPREKQLISFVTTRVNPMFKESILMKDLLNEPDQTFVKGIGDQSFWFFRSAWEMDLGEGVDLDGVTFDEKDRMKGGIEEAFKQSLGSSAYKLIREVSTPTLPGRGVDVTWRRSSQYEWFVKCRKCGLQQYLTMENIEQVKPMPQGEKTIPRGTYRYACKRKDCRGDLDRFNGQWVAGHAHRAGDVAGYHISKLMCVWLTADDIMQDKLDAYVDQIFFNYDLGEVAQTEDLLVTEEDLASLHYGAPVSYRSNKWRWISVGIDWGKWNWAVVYGLNENGRKYILNLFATEDSGNRALKAAKDILDFIRPYRPDIVVADAGYGREQNAFLASQLNGATKIAYACRYNPNAKGSKIVPQWNEKDGEVLVHRTVSLKRYCRQFVRQQIGIPDPDKCELVRIFKKHLTALSPMFELDEDTNEPLETIGSSGDDHFAHSGNYASIGLEHLIGDYTVSVEFLDDGV